MKGKILVTLITALFVSPALYSQYDYFTIDTLGEKLACDSLTLVFTGSTIQSPVYSWDFGNGVTSNQIKDTVTFYPGTYTVIYTNNPFTESATIIVNQKPVAAFTDSVIPNTGYFSRIFVDHSAKDINNNPAYTYTINYGDGSSITGETINLLKKYSKPGTYNIQMVISDQLSCTDSTTITIDITDTGLTNLPNIFTPNNDGANDLFIIEGNGQTIMTFEVFNRAGALIYKSESKIISWDGKTMTGNDAPTGVYFFILTSEDNYYDVVKNTIYLFRDNN